MDSGEMNNMIRILRDMHEYLSSLEQLLKARHGEGWDTLTLAEAKRARVDDIRFRARIDELHRIIRDKTRCD